MLTREELNEIWARYANAEWADADPMQCVFDIGRLMGHASALEQTIRDLRGIVAHHEAERVALLRGFAHDRDHPPDGRM